MGLLERVAERRAGGSTPEARALAVPWRPWDSRFIPFSAGGPAHPSQMAVGIDASLRLAPLYAGARLLADMVASLPLDQYRKLPAGRPQKMTLGPLFTKPAVYGTIYDWLHQAMTSLVLTGNAWGLVTGRDGYGFPSGIEWLPPDRVEVVNDQEQPWNPLRARIYFEGAQMGRDDLFHVRAFTVPGRIEGLSPLRLFMELIQSGQDAVGYGASWFRSGGFPPGTFQNQEIEIDQPSADEIRRRLTSSIQRREPLVYGRDWEYKPLSVPPNEAQFVEALQMNATQIAAVLGIPPDRVGGSRGDSLTYNTVELNEIELLTDTIRPWLVRLETAFFDCLPQQQYVRFNPDAMLRTTTLERYQVYQLARNMGLATADEIRELEERGPLPAGVGSDPIPLEVLVAMARSIKEIPKSFQSLVDVGPVDKANIALAQAGKQPVPGQQQGPGDDGGSSGASGGGAPSANGNGSSNGNGDTTAAAAAARARWPGDYDLSPAAIRQIMNGASHG